MFASLAWGLSVCGSVRSSQVHAVATLCGIFGTQPRYPLRFATDLARNRSAWLPWITDWSRNAAPGYDQWDVSQHMAATQPDWFGWRAPSDMSS